MEQTFRKALMEVFTETEESKVPQDALDSAFATWLKTQDITLLIAYAQAWGDKQAQISCMQGRQELHDVYFKS